MTALSITIDDCNFYLLRVSNLFCRDLRTLQNLSSINEEFVIKSRGLYFDYCELYIIVPIMAYNLQDYYLSDYQPKLITDSFQITKPIKKKDFYLDFQKDIHFYPGDKVLQTYSHPLASLSTAQEQIINYFQDIIGKEDSQVTRATYSLFSRLAEKGNLAKKISVCYLLASVFFNNENHQFLIAQQKRAFKIILEVQGVLFV
jgi:hypothetical protein